MSDYFHYHYHCPYMSGTDGKTIYCKREEDSKSSRICCPSVASCRRYVQSHCADAKGYHRCTIAQILEDAVYKKIVIKERIRTWKN